MDSHHPLPEECRRSRNDTPDLQKGEPLRAGWGGGRWYIQGFNGTTVTSFFFKQEMDPVGFILETGLNQTLIPYTLWIDILCVTYKDWAMVKFSWQSSHHLNWFKYVVLWYWIYSQCCVAIPTFISRSLCSPYPEILDVLDTSPIVPPIPTPCLSLPPQVLCICQFYEWNQVVFMFLQWACVRIFILLKAK